MRALRRWGATALSCLAIATLLAAPARAAGPMTDPVVGELAFVRTRPRGGEVWLLDVATGTVRQLTNDGAHDANPAWFEDSSRVAYDSDRSGRRDIWTVEVSNGTSTEIDTGSGNNSDPSVRARNGTLAFVSDRSGAPAIWTMAYPTGSPEQATDGSVPDHA